MHDYGKGHFVNCQRLDYLIPSPLSLSSIILDPWANIKCLSHFSIFLIPTRIRCGCFQIGIETLKLRGSCNIDWSLIQRIFEGLWLLPRCGARCVAYHGLKCRFMMQWADRPKMGLTDTPVCRAPLEAHHVTLAHPSALAPTYGALAAFNSNSILIQIQLIRTNSSIWSML